MVDKTIFLDIETTGLTAMECRVTCICAQELEDDNKSFAMAGDDERELLDSFLEWLLKYSVKETTLVTANGKSFDIPFIYYRCLEVLKDSDWNLEKLQMYDHFDLDVDITSRRISLNDIARLYRVDTKTAKGTDAIRWFHNKEFGKLKDYCWNDVMVTKQCYLKYKELER